MLWKELKSSVLTIKPLATPALILFFPVCSDRVERVNTSIDNILECSDTEGRDYGDQIPAVLFPLPNEKAFIRITYINTFHCKLNSLYNYFVYKVYVLLSLDVENVRQ